MMSGKHIFNFTYHLDLCLAANDVGSWL